MAKASFLVLLGVVVMAIVASAGLGQVPRADVVVRTANAGCDCQRMTNALNAQSDRLLQLIRQLKSPEEFEEYTDVERETWPRSADIVELVNFRMRVLQDLIPR